jgi:hypothetical protein
MEQAMTWMIRIQADMIPKAMTPMWKAMVGVNALRTDTNPTVVGAAAIVT